MVLNGYRIPYAVGCCGVLHTSIHKIVEPGEEFGCILEAFVAIGIYAERFNVLAEIIEGKTVQVGAVALRYEIGRTGFGRVRKISAQI